MRSKPDYVEFLIKTPTQPNITLSWVRHENGFANHPTQYLSCCSPDFDETLNVGSWEHLE